MKVHYRTHKRPQTVSILGQPNPVHTSWRSILILSTHLRLGLPSGLLIFHIYYEYKPKINVELEINFTLPVAEVSYETPHRSYLKLLFQSLAFVAVVCHETLLLCLPELKLKFAV